MSPDPCKGLFSSSCGPLFLLTFPWGRSDVRGVFCEFCLPMCTLKRHSCLQAWGEGGGRPGASSFSWSLCHAASAPPAPGGITPCPGEVSNLEMSFLNFQGIDKSLLCPWGTLAPDRWFPHAFFFPEHCWQWSNRAEHEDLSTLQGNGEVLIMLIMEIRDNLCHGEGNWVTPSWFLLNAPHPGCVLRLGLGTVLPAPGLKGAAGAGWGLQHHAQHRQGHVLVLLPSRGASCEPL